MIGNEYISLAHVMPFCHLSDEDFDLALYEQQNGAIRFDPDRLETLNSILSFPKQTISLLYVQIMILTLISIPRFPAIIILKIDLTNYLIT